MEEHFIDITPENLYSEHLCCLSHSLKPNAGIDAKRRWLADRLRGGHVFRRLDAKATVFIEYAPLESAWTPVVGENYLYVYCLWVDSGFKGRGYGTYLMNSCIEDAKARGKAGLCMLGADKQRAWLSDQAFAKRFGFSAADTAAGGYELLALSFDGTKPRFTDAARRGEIDSKALTVYYTEQCPYTARALETVRARCEQLGEPVDILFVDTLEKAKALPCPINNWAVFYRGRLETVNLTLDSKVIDRILKNT